MGTTRRTIDYSTHLRSIFSILNSKHSTTIGGRISRIYGGTPNPERDAGLNGVKFVDMPWVLTPDDNAARLQAALQDYGKDNLNKYNLLHPFGVDPYYLLPQLQ